MANQNTSLEDLGESIMKDLKNLLEQAFNKGYDCGVRRGLTGQSYPRKKDVFQEFIKGLSKNDQTQKEDL